MKKKKHYTDLMEDKLPNDGKLRENYQYYLDNYDELVKQYDGKVLVLTDCRVADVCDDELQAYEEGAVKYGLGNFIFQRCSHDFKTSKVKFSSSHYIPRITPEGVLPPLISFGEKSAEPKTDNVRSTHRVRREMVTQA